MSLRTNGYGRRSYDPDSEAALEKLSQEKHLFDPQIFLMSAKRGLSDLNHASDPRQYKVSLPIELRASFLSKDKR